MKFKSFSLFVAVLFLICACSFNSTFHRPTQIATFDDSSQFYSEKDSLYVVYKPDSEEVILKDSGLNVINKKYTIQNKYFISSSGNKLNGWLLTPNYTETKATILHFHGSAGNLLSQYSLISPLIDFGYQIFMFDYSGYGSSEGKPTHEVVLQDAYSALNYLQKKVTEESKIIIYGQSYGGYLVSIVGSNSQQKIDALVIEGAFSSFKEQARHNASFLGNFVKRGIPADEEIKRNHKPLLIIHSREDQMVPIKLGRKIYDNANEPKEFYEIDGPHIGGLENYSNEIAIKINQMINN